MHSGFTDAPNWVPPQGIPPIGPASTVRVIQSNIPSSFATAETYSGIPIQRFTTVSMESSKAALRPITFLGLNGGIGIPPTGTVKAPQTEGSKSMSNDC